jgi:hypothetical protein
MYMMKPESGETNYEMVKNETIHRDEKVRLASPDDTIDFDPKDVEGASLDGLTYLGKDQETRFPGSSEERNPA